MIGSPTSLRRHLMRGGIGSLGIKFASTLLGLVLTIFLARALGPENYGVYAYVFAILSLLAIPTQLGLPSLIVRETAKAQAAGQWGIMRGLWRWSTIVVCSVSCLVMLVIVAVFWIFQDQVNERLRATFVVGLLLIPLIVLGELRGAALRGLRHILVGQLPENILRPSFLILLLLLVQSGLLNIALSAVTVMGLHAIAAAMAFAIGAVLLWGARPPELVNRPQPIYLSRAWIMSALPLALVSGLHLINMQASFLILGLFETDQGLGIYKVVITSVTLVTFGLQAINMVVMPYFARFYANNDQVRLQRLVTQSVRVIFSFAIPIVIAFIFFGKQILTVVFGQVYAQGHTALAILALGQLVSAGTGSVGVLLNMTGHERDTLRGIGLAAIANVILSLLLIPPFGIEGAAVAAAFTLIVWNLLLRKAVKQRMRIETMVFHRNCTVL